MRNHFVKLRAGQVPAVGEIWIQSLGREDPLAKAKAINSSILAWRIPWRRFDNIFLSGSRGASEPEWVDDFLWKMEKGDLVGFL